MGLIQSTDLRDWDIQWGSIICEQNVRWLHLSWLKASAVYPDHLKTGRGVGIWQGMEPHFSVLNICDEAQALDLSRVHWVQQQDTYANLCTKVSKSKMLLGKIKWLTVAWELVMVWIFNEGISAASLCHHVGMVPKYVLQLLSCEKSQNY